MQDLITSFIIQAKECRLRDVGRFKMSVIAAQSDIANKQIIPPATEILFTSREENISDGLVKYIADKKQLRVSQALDDLKKWRRNFIETFGCHKKRAIRKYIYSPKLILSIL